jgi:hypothetical protein
MQTADGGGAALGLTPTGPEGARARWRAAVTGAVEFTLERLLSRSRPGVRFRYLEAEQLLIHNANLLAARFVARAGVAVGERSWIETARESLPVTLAAIGHDGLLPYGEGSHEAWVDGHHTGFVAEALADLSTLLDDPDLGEVATTVRRAYRRSLFASGGRPLLYPGRRFPIDVITGAQGIQTFAKSGAPEDVRFSAEIAGFTLSNLRTRSGTFMYRKGRLHAKTVPYVRWSDAPMCLSLAHLARAMIPSRPVLLGSVPPLSTDDSVPA